MRLLSLLVLLLPATAAAGVPDDIAALNAAGALIEAAGQAGEMDEDSMVIELANLVGRNCTLIAKENGLPASVSANITEFRKQIRKAVRPKVAAAAQMRHEKRVTELYRVLRQVAHRAFAQEQLAEWLATAKVGSFGEVAVEEATAKAKVLADKDQADAAKARGDRPLTAAERVDEARQGALESARADKAVTAARLAERFRRQVDVANGTGSLRPVVSSAALGADWGGPGEGNGVVDAGEWVTFSIAIENVSRDPWYSSSAWVKSAHECAWSAPGREVELPEIEPGGVASLEISAYFSEACPERTRVPFLVEVRDSLRTPSQALTMDVGLRVSNVGAGLLRAPTFDRDVPGSSDAEESKRLVANQRLELSAGFAVEAAGATSALQAWGLSKDVSDVISGAEFRLGQPMVPVSVATGAAFGPYDDFDLGTNREEAFEAAMKSTAKRREWNDASQAGGVAIVETVVSYPGLEGAWAPVATVVVPPAPVEPPTAPPAPSAAATLALLQPLISVRAREVKPEDGALAAATTTIFDAHVDEVAFKRAWCEATAVRRPGEPDPCDPNANPEPPSEPKPVVVSVPSFTAPANYTFRNFIWLSTKWTPDEPEPKPEPKREPTPVPRPEPEPEPEPGSLFRISAGLELGLSTFNDAPVEGILFGRDQAVEAQVIGDVSVGKRQWRGHVGGGIALGLTDNVITGQSLSAVNLTGGIGYAVPLLEQTLEVEPQLRLGVRLVAVEGEMVGVVSPAVLGSPIVEAGTSVRGRVSGAVDLWGAVLYRIDLPSFLLIDNSGVKLQIGVGVRF